MKKDFIDDDILKSKRIGVRKLVGEYVLESTQVFPYTQCKIRVWFDIGRQYYLACSNIGVRDVINNTVDRECGIGKTEEEALNDQIKCLLSMIESYE